MVMHNIEAMVVTVHSVGTFAIGCQESMLW